jgi:hypothetical protein
MGRLSRTPTTRWAHTPSHAHHLQRVHALTMQTPLPPFPRSRGLRLYPTLTKLNEVLVLVPS